MRSPGYSGPEQAFNIPASIADALCLVFQILIPFAFLPGLLPDPIPSFPKPAQPLATSLSSLTGSFAIFTWVCSTSTSKPSENLINEGLGSETHAPRMAS